MFKSYKYRLYPKTKQAISLETQLAGHCFLYNKALEQRREIYHRTGKGIGFFTQSTDLLPGLKKENEILALCNYASLNQTLRRLDKSFKDFYSRVKAGEKPGYPRFKSSNRFNTIFYAIIGNGCQIKDSRLYLQNVGCVKVKWHRPIKGNIKTLSVTRRNGKWYVCFYVEYEASVLPKTGKEIGIDLGLNTVIATSDGQRIFSRKYLKTAETHLVKYHKQLSRKIPGSIHRKKTCILLAKRHEKITNQRLDFYHKIAYSFVRNYDGFAVENLKIKNMIKNKYFAKGIADASWGVFLSILKSKAGSAGRWYREVSPNGTSQECSGCGVIVKKPLSVRMHSCPHCGLHIDRDVNAARNILARTGPSQRGGVAIPLVEARSQSS